MKWNRSEAICAFGSDAETACDLIETNAQRTD
jgi:hypothetical protein